MIKTRAHGFDELVCKWVESFLTGRKQRIVLGSEVSEWSNVKSGVPQGSVLGPMLFIVFINDLPENLHFPSKLYADDCKIIAIIKSLNGALLLQQDIDTLSRWCFNWQMKFNSEKC